MAKSSQYHNGGRYTMLIEFDMPSIPPSREALKDFVAKALESMGGCRHPDDQLFNSLGRVKVSGIHRKKTAAELRKSQHKPKTFCL